MNRRDLLKNAVLGAGALSTSAMAQAPVKPNFPRGAELAELAHERGIPGSPRRTGSEPPPNILWVCTDQQRFDTIQGLSNSQIRTPNLQKFMADSVTFTNVFVQTPICSPSRGSFLTGRYPHCTGLRANGEYIRTTELVVPRILADNGYTCGLSGKLHLSATAGPLLEPDERINDGYKLFEWSHDLSRGGEEHNAWLAWLKKQGLKIPPAPKGHVWGMPIDPKYTQTAWCADVAMKFMREQTGKGPWMMSVNIFQPHHPFYPTAEYLAHYDPKQMPDPAYKEGELDTKTPFQQLDHQAAYGGTAMSFVHTTPEDRREIKAAYYAMIEQVDTEVGHMLQTLEETGQADNTIVIFMSDHGEMLGDHGLYLKGPFFYDCLTRVPLIIRWPRRYKAGLKVDALVEMIDLAPTLLEAAGIPAAQGMQGRSLTPLLTGQTTQHRDSVFMEYINANFTYPTTPMIYSLRTDKWKLNFCQQDQWGELYDLRNDPEEFNNVYTNSHHTDAREQMMHSLMTRLLASIDPIPEKIANW